MTAPRRRAAIVVAAASLALAMATVAAVRLGSSSEGRRDGRPNILVIVTDDQRASGTLAVMPETRRWFAEGGARFPHAFATTPYCCPSRASILTGQYAHNHGLKVAPSARAASPESDFQRSTLERYLQDGGYRTAIFGKYLNGLAIRRDPPYFDEWATIRVPHHVSYYGGEVNAGGDTGPVGDYHTHYVRDRALSFLEDAADDSRPWFMYVAFKAPHAPYTAEPKYRQAPVPPGAANPGMEETDLSDKPPFVTRRLVGNADAETLRARQLRTLMSVDDAVGALFDELARSGDDERTLAIFTSDNGYTWGEHGLVARKLVPYTPSVAVPLLIRWPGHVSPGTVDQRLASTVDVAPTALAAAGVRPDARLPVDGRSLLDADRRRRLLLEFWSVGAVPDWASVRARKHQYVEYYDSDGTVVFREYYDLRRDRWQLTNLLQDGVPGNAPDTSSLARQLAADRRCAGDACP